MLDLKPALLRLSFAVSVAVGLGLAAPAAASPGSAARAAVAATLYAQNPSPWEHTVGIGSYSTSDTSAQATASSICDGVVEGMRTQDKAKVVGHRAILSSGARRCRVWFASERDLIKVETRYRDWWSKTVVLEDTDMDTKTARISTYVDWMQCARHSVDKAEYGSVVFQTSGSAKCWYKKSKDPAKLEYQAYRRTILEVDTPTWVRFRKLVETRVQGQDRYGNDIEKISNLSLDACTLRCAATAGCKAYTWRSTDKHCWLKSAGGNPSGAAISLFSGVIPAPSGGGGPG